MACPPQQPHEHIAPQHPPPKISQTARTPGRRALQGGVEGGAQPHPHIGGGGGGGGYSPPAVGGSRGVVNYPPGGELTVRYKRHFNSHYKHQMA